MSGPPPAIAPELLEDLSRALVDELPELAPARVRESLARAAARVAEEYARAAGWDEVIEDHLDRVSAADEGEDRAVELLQLAAFIEQETGNVDRALTARLAALAEAPDAVDGDDLLRLATTTGRWAEVAAALTAAVDAAPGRADMLRALAGACAAAGQTRQRLDALAALVDVTADDAARAQLYRELAAGWEALGCHQQAAECHEWVLAFAPGDAHAHAALERSYRAGGRWRALIDLLSRTAGGDAAERAARLRDIGDIYDRHLGDGGGAIDAYRLADELEPDRPEVVDALARLLERRGADDEALAVLERLARLVSDDQRAVVLHRAAELAWRKLGDAGGAHDRLVRARHLAPDLIAATRSLAALQRERGQLAEAIDLLVDAAGRPGPAAERAGLFAEAADLCLHLGDGERAAELYRCARAADPTDRRIAEALAELYWQAGAHADLVPIAEALCASAVDAADRRRHLVRLGRALEAVEDLDGARDALTRALDVDPLDAEARRALAEVCFEQRAWADARAIIEGLLDDCEDSLARAACVALHYRAGRCARELGDDAGAGMHAATALALDPGHRPSLLLRAELDAADPQALVADQLALAHAAPPEEKAARFAAIGDLYADKLGDPAAAGEMYREALSYRPTDRVLLTRCLGLIAGQGDWSHSLELLQRLIDTEDDRAVRARYRHVAATICIQELGRTADGAALLQAAITDDPAQMRAADDLEALLAAGEPAALLRFYSLRLDQLRDAEPRPGERLRLWRRLGELCLRLGRRDDATCAFEVAVELDPDDLGGRHRLADLYVDAGGDRLDQAIAQHQEILRASKQRVSSYEALRSLYQRTGQPEKARACEEALGIIGVRAVAGRTPVRTGPPPVLHDGVPGLDADAWRTLAGGEVDRLLSVLFALVGPALAAARAHSRPIARLSERSLAGERDANLVGHVLRHLIPVLGIDRPPVFVDREQEAVCRLTLRGDGGLVVPAVILGRTALDGSIGERELAFMLGRRLADLRPDRIARLLCPRADELARIIEVAAALQPDDPAAAGHTGRWLIGALRPMDLDQMAVVGDRLRERGVDPGPAALEWLQGTERVGDRVGFLLAGDLATCVAALEREPATRAGKQERILDLVWSTITEPVFAVRERIERWPVGRVSPGHRPAYGRPPGD